MWVIRARVDAACRRWITTRPLAGSNHYPLRVRAAPSSACDAHPHTPDPHQPSRRSALAAHARIYLNMMSPVIGLRGTSRLMAMLVLFGLALIVVLCAILLSTQPAAA